MADLGQAIADVLDLHVGDRGAAGIAVVARPSAPPVAVWVPSSARDEPAYLIYSITKTFVAVLLLSLSDEGRLALDDPLSRWFPRILPGRPISLRQLLNHTAGLPDYGDVAAYHDDQRAAPARPWRFERFAAETFEKGLRFEPGTGWAYSNPGYMLLRRVVEEVAGASLAALIAERIAGSLGLSRTFVPGSVEDLSSLAPATSTALALDRSPRDIRRHYHPGWVSHGVVASTASDVARFFDALFGGRLVSPASLREMTTLVPLPMIPEAHRVESPWGRPGYGLGIMGDQSSRWGRLWGHDGGGPGYRTSAFHAPDMTGVSVAAMCAVEDDRRAERLAFAALDVLRGR